MSLLNVVSEDIDLRFLWLLTGRLSSALASFAIRKPDSPNFINISLSVQVLISDILLIPTCLSLFSKDGPTP